MIKAWFYIAIVILMSGCNTVEEIITPPFSHFSVLGEWNIHWEAGYISKLFVTVEYDFVFEGLYQDDLGYQVLNPMQGAVHVGYDIFGFTVFMTDYTIKFECIMAPDLLHFKGTAYLYDAYNGTNLHMMQEFDGVWMGPVSDQ